ncbi:hypothetical protein [Streptomyces sp. Da 82-17]|uniref:hypothetical protein n=1 Tax=Streptomyces sp. Da 82-17 TaxID=3377116 RepID=UPI0038D36AC3
MSLTPVTPQEATRRIAARALAQVLQPGHSRVAEDYRRVEGFGELPEDLRTVEAEEGSRIALEMLLGRLAGRAGRRAGLPTDFASGPCSEPRRGRRWT